MDNTHKLLLSLIGAMGHEVEEIRGVKINGLEIDAGEYLASMPISPNDSVEHTMEYKLTKQDNPHLQSSVLMNRISAIYADASTGMLDRHNAVELIIEEYDKDLK